MTLTQKTQFGNLTEKYALQYLESKGYGIISKNYRQPWGEIDLIAEKEGILVFVEVKANNKEIEGFEPELRVNREKIKKIIRTARTFIAEKRYGPEQGWQIDIIAITLDKSRKMAKISHFKNIETF